MYIANISIPRMPIIAYTSFCRYHFRFQTISQVMTFDQEFWAWL